MTSASTTDGKPNSRPNANNETVRDDLVRLIYRGPLESQPWQSFVDRLRGAMDALALAIVLFPNNSNVLETHVLATAPGQDFDWTALNRRYVRDYLEIDPTRSDKIEPGQIVLGQDYHDNAYFADFLRPLGIEHTVRMGLSEPGGMRCWLSASRLRHQHAFGADDISLLEHLRPHLEQALELYANIMLSQSEKSLYNEAIEHLSFGSILLNGERRIISANPIANAIIKRHPELRVNNALLTLGDAAANAELQRAIDAAIAGRDANNCGEVELVRVECRSGNLLGLLVRPIPPQPYYRGAPTPHVVIYLSDLEQHIDGWNHAQREPQQLIAKLFKLTQAESRLATLLADGKTLAEAAVAMHITEKTARNHAKNIYDKTGIKRQVDLVRLIYKSVALLG